MKTNQPALGETITVQLTGKVVMTNNEPPFDVMLDIATHYDDLPKRMWVLPESIIQPQAAETESRHLADVMIKPQPKYMVTCPYCGYLNYYNEPRNGWLPKNGQRKFIICECLEVVDL